jgi:purine nucleoside phosphorylase
MQAQEHPLDAAVHGAASELAKLGVPTTGALLLLATGLGTLPSKLRHAGSVKLGRAKHVPGAWKEATLHWGELNGLACWLLEDALGPADEGGREQPGAAAWVRAFPVWLAKLAGARHLIHVSAATALPEAGKPLSLLGSLVVAEDHINLSGGTPLHALSGSTLGPLFPAVSTLHDSVLRPALLTEAKRQGIPLEPAVVACVAGPSMSTPAERRWWRTAGASVAIQDLTPPLLAAAHAGLSVVALSAVVDAGSDDIPTVLLRAERAVPQIEELVWAFAPHVAKAVAAAERDEA